MRNTILLATGLMILGNFGAVDRVLAVAVKPIDPTFSWLFDDATGTTASAQFGPHDGTLNGGASFTNSNTPFSYDDNYAIQLDGSSGFVEVADALDLRPGTSAWTTSAWFQVPDVNESGAIMTKRMNSGTFNQWATYVGDTTTGVLAGKKIQQVIYDGGPSWWYHTDNDIVDGGWHHVAIVRPSSGDAIMYIDGVAAAITAISDNNTEPQDIDNTDPWQFGYSNGASFYLNGTIDEFAMWNSALSADNIAWLATNSLNPPPVPEPSSCLLLCLGALGLVRHTQRRRQRA